MYAYNRLRFWGRPFEFRSVCPRVDIYKKFFIPYIITFINNKKFNKINLYSSVMYKVGYVMSGLIGMY